jgi:hypothetical protein
MKIFNLCCNLDGVLTIDIEDIDPLEEIGEVLHLVKPYGDEIVIISSNTEETTLAVYDDKRNVFDMKEAILNTEGKIVKQVE